MSDWSTKINSTCLQLSSVLTSLKRRLEMSLRSRALNLHAHSRQNVNKAIYRLMPMSEWCVSKLDLWKKNISYLRDFNGLIFSLWTYVISKLINRKSNPISANRECECHSRTVTWHERWVWVHGASVWVWLWMVRCINALSRHKKNEIAKFSLNFKYFFMTEISLDQINILYAFAQLWRGNVHQKSMRYN